jgi:hypothetical protein
MPVSLRGRIQGQRAFGRSEDPANAFAESGIANADFSRLHQQTPAGLRGTVRLRYAQFVLPRGAVTL